MYITIYVGGAVTLRVPTLHALCRLINLELRELFD